MPYSDPAQQKAYEAGFQAGKRSAEKKVADITIWEEGFGDGFDAGIEAQVPGFDISKILNELSQLRRIADMLEAIIRTQHWA